MRAREELNDLFKALHHNITLFSFCPLSIIIHHAIYFMLFEFRFTFLSLINSLDTDVKRLGETEEVG